jgi:hypothetical protein
MAASRLGLDNPFVDSIVRDPWSDLQAEVPDIGRAAFEVCRREIDNVRGYRISRSVLLHGAPGCGKTHLVARVRHYLENRGAPSWPDSVFVAVQMHTSPSRIWRHLRRRFAEDLLRRPAACPSQLERIVYRRMAEPESKGGYLNEWREQILAEFQGPSPDPQHLAFALWTIVEHLDRKGALDALRGDLYERLAGDANIPLALQRVLRHIAQRRHSGLAHGWLRGESLPESDLAILGTEPGVGAEEEEQPEDDAREVVLHLIRLAAVPVVFCLDQVEALGDVTGFLALGNALTSLHDLTSNTLIICCIQSQYLGTLPAALGSGYARISESVQELPGVDHAQAEQLVCARLGGQAEDCHDQLSIENFEDLFKDTGTATPRSVIARAAALFGQEGRTLPEALAEKWESYVERAERANRPEISDQILEHGLPLLLRLGRPERVIGAGSRDLQFTVSGPGLPVGVSICNHTNMTSLAGRLRRLTSEILPPDRLAIVRDPRLPISKNARTTRKYLDELTARGARIVHANPEALAALEALRILLSETRSGDLAHDGGSVKLATVESWLASNLPSSLSGLLRDLSLENSAESSSPQSIDLREDLIDLLAKRSITSLAEAARAVGRTESEVIACASDCPGVIGFLAGPPPLLYHVVAASAPGGAG